MEAKVGSKWRSDGKTYVVIKNYVDSDGNNWVHYKEDRSGECQEYSCWVESFVRRFVAYNNYSYN